MIHSFKIQNIKTMQSSRITAVFSLCIASVLFAFLAFVVSPKASGLTAANGDYEAESSTALSSKNIKSYNDSSASGARALQYYVNGTATKSVSTPAVTNLTVFARGAQCGSAPVAMTVKVNGAPVLSAQVGNTAYAGFSTESLALDAGIQTVEIAFTNDYYVSPSCDRNLIVDRIEFTSGEIKVPPKVCNSTVPLPINADPGTTVLSDGFESNNFSNWTRVVQEADATAVVQTNTVKIDNCAAKIHVTANTGSRANISKTLPSASREVWATGWFNITRQGASTASNVPTFRFFNGSTRILDVSRQNGSGSFFVRYPSATGNTIVSTGRTLNVNQWYQIKIHAVANGQQSQVEVWLDGTKVFDRTNSTTGYATFGNFTSITSLMVGAEHVLQDGDFVADDIVAKVLQ